MSEVPRDLRDSDGYLGHNRNKYGRKPYYYDQEDTEEQRQLWEQIKTDARRVDKCMVLHRPCHVACII